MWATFFLWQLNCYILILSSVHFLCVCVCATRQEVFVAVYNVAMKNKSQSTQPCWETKQTKQGLETAETCSGGREEYLIR